MNLPLPHEAKKSHVDAYNIDQYDQAGENTLQQLIQENQKRIACARKYKVLTSPVPSLFVRAGVRILRTARYLVGRGYREENKQRSTFRVFDPETLKVVYPPEDIGMTIHDVFKENSTSATTRR